jgi:DNA (cytosine-5)-methyltransferase 1
VLDAQYFGLAQRRKRVFVVGHLGDWRRAAAVLFERESLSWNPPPRGKAGKDVAVSPTLRAGGNSTGGDRPPGTDVDTIDSLIAVPIQSVQAVREKRQNGIGIGSDGDEMFTLTGRDRHAVAFSCKDYGADVGDISPTLRAMGFDGSHANAGGQVAIAYRTTGNDGCYELGDLAGCLNTNTDPSAQVVAFHENQRGELTTNDTAGSLKVGGGKPGQGYPAVNSGSAVRRLTPRECERLQGFPDDYTAIPYRGKPAADGPRYKALGNSMAVPCMAWIGNNINRMDSILE